MAVRRCPHCRVVNVEWMYTKFGKRMVFEYDLVPVDELGERIGWIPGQWPVGRRNQLVMAPLAHYGDHKRGAARRVAVLHVCGAYRQARGLPVDSLIGEPAQ